MVPRLRSQIGVVDLLYAVYGVQSPRRMSASSDAFAVPTRTLREPATSRGTLVSYRATGLWSGDCVHSEMHVSPMRATNLVSPFVCSGADVSWPLHSRLCYVVTYQNGCGEKPRQVTPRGVWPPCALELCLICGDSNQRTFSPEVGERDRAPTAAYEGGRQRIIPTTKVHHHR